MSLIAGPRLARILLCAVSATLLWLLGAGAAAASTTFTVTQTADTTGGTCTPGSCSVRQALASAADGDTVFLPAKPKHYVLTNGQLVVGKGITLLGAGASVSVIEAQDAARVMLINGNTAAVKLTNLTLTGGSTTGPGGGGIAAGGPGRVVLTGVSVSGNHVAPTAPGFNQGGGGIFSRVPVALLHSTVSNNSVGVTHSDGDSGGGGILMAMSAGDLSISDSTVSSNSATVTPASGAGIDNNGGGGIYQDGSGLTVSRSLVQGNTTTITSNAIVTPADGGGGIYQFGTNLLIDQSTIAGNKAHGPGVDKGGGGGVFDDGDASQYLNSTIANNTTDEPAAGSDASDGGGGVLFDTVQHGVVMANMTITGNHASAATGGGINSSITPSVELSNSIIAGNTAASGKGNCAGKVHSDGFNLADDTSANSCQLASSGDLLRSSTHLGPLADNGGPTPTEALLAGSPAINAGNPSGCTDLLGGLVLTDQRDVARPQPAGGRCDMGAYELALPIISSAASSRVGGKLKLTSSVSNPDPRNGTVRFDFGLTPAYGRSTASQSLPGRSTGSSFSASPSALEPGRTYHFRAVATTPAGTTTSADKRFRAPKVAPRRFTIKVKPKAAPAAPVQLTVSGRLKLPATVTPARGCRGSIRVRATVGGVVVASTHTSVSPSCHYAVKLTISGHGLVGSTKVRVRARFGGNRALLAHRAGPVIFVLG